MMVYRLCRSEHANDLKGTGAELCGGRWNSKGVAMLYTSSSRALCLAEIAVSLSLNILPDDFKIVTISIPDNIQIEELQFRSLPPNWQQFPHPNSTQVIGDLFIKNMLFPVLKVPSVVVPMEHNFLINPTLVAASEIKIEDISDFQIDGRLKPR